ncbi:MAG: DUF6527 family protein [Candidatus Nanopelagicales bacterium]
MKLTTIAPEFVISFPPQLAEGILYVSAQFATAAHLCACGCGREVITPLSPAQWVLTFDGNVSLEPSIGNWSLPCQSHYVIAHGKINWARGFTPAQIERNRISDHGLRDEVLATEHATEHVGWWSRLTRFFRRRAD